MGLEALSGIHQGHQISPTCGCCLGCHGAWPKRFQPTLRKEMRAGLAWLPAGLAGWELIHQSAGYSSDLSPQPLGVTKVQALDDYILTPTGFLKMWIRDGAWFWILSGIWIADCSSWLIASKDRVKLKLSQPTVTKIYSTQRLDRCLLQGAVLKPRSGRLWFQVSGGSL